MFAVSTLLRLYDVIIQNVASRTTSTLQHKCCVQFEHCQFQFSVFTGNILIWIHIPIFNQKIKVRVIHE